MLNRLSTDEWDVMIFVASYISGYGTRPSQAELAQAKLPECAVNRLLRKELLINKNGGLEPGLSVKESVIRTAV